MVGRLLARGMAAGIVAALLGFVFAKLFGEPQVALAIAFEAAQDAAAGNAPEPELVSRAVQASYGLLTAVLMYGAAYGGVFAIVFAVAYKRLNLSSPRALALLLAGVGFLTFVLIPDLKYPPNPPAVGLEETIGLRTAMYFAMVGIAIAISMISLLVGRALAAPLGRWNAALCGIGLGIALVVVAQFGLPDINEVPGDFPAIVLWRFREAAIGMQLVMWSTLGLVFGALAEKLLQSTRVQAR
ncbi:CbtA family protein [Acetobacter sp. LMG 32666]|uniref:CbtA family protein n=1 Tax=Acetobacter sp. LMG 32666 TaxID=2959295 RepID=UPI0030C84D47